MDTHYKNFLWMVLVLFSVVVTAQERVSKTIEKSYALNADGELQIENKYGNLNFTGWDQNRVKIVISVNVNHRKLENAKDLLGRIYPEISTSSDVVSITSKIENRNSGWFADFFNKNNPIDVDRSRVRIDYDIFLPKSAELKVTNRFGDVILEGWNGELRALIEHGDLWIGENLSRADIVLKYGKVRAKNLNYASLNLKNGELDMQDSKSLRLNSEGTDIKINSVNSLELYSNKDDIDLKETGNLFGSLKFSTLHLENLSNDVDMRMKIADFVVYGITEANASIVIEQESSDITLHVTDFSHRFDATLEQGVVRLPKSFENVNSTMLDKGKKLRAIKATYGNTQNGHISVKGIKGIVTIND